MKTIKNFEGINKKNIINMAMVADQDEHMLHITAVIDDTEQERCSPLNTGFEIHACNEFLRSIYPGSTVQFSTYGSYKHEISSAMTMLTIQRMIDAAGAEVSAQDVRTMLLNDKEDFGFNALEVGLQNGHLTEYVQQAIELLNKKSAKKVKCAS